MISGCLTGFGSPGILRQKAAGGLLLDRYTASAAWSMRLLRAAYTGSCLRLRRASDNAESDFGFVNGWVDTAAIATWIGASSATITTWYDQTGNTKHLLQATSGNQPAWNATGILSAKPGIVFTAASSHYLRASFATIAQPVSEFAIFQASSIAATRTLSDSAATTVSRICAQAAVWELTTGGTSLTGGTSDTSTHQLTSLKNGGSSKLRIDGTQILSGAAGAGGVTSGFTMGTRFTNANYFQGPVGEFIIFGSDQSANFATIEADQKAAWGTP